MYMKINLSTCRTSCDTPNLSNVCKKRISMINPIDKKTTLSGRHLSLDPPVQNIPINTPQGKVIKQAFLSNRTYTDLKVRIMDPQQCLYEFLGHIYEDNREDALELLEGLKDWINNKCGVLPAVGKTTLENGNIVYQVKSGRDYLEEYRKGQQS